MTLTHHELAELERLEQAATPGPWGICRAQGSKCSCGLVWSIPGDCVVAESKADAEFIAAARNAVPRFRSELRRLSDACRDHEAAIGMLLEKVAWLRQTIHQAHHDGPIEACRVNTCRSATDIIVGE